MGWLDSLPLVSQIKSLVQVIGGDAKGAKETQEKFARTGYIASQVSSLVASIEGDQKKAAKIQAEFVNNAYELAQGLPVVGHGISLGYEIAGDEKEAARIALIATKSTVSALAGAAGVVCGPGAPACAGALAVSASTAWDAVDSGVRGGKVGSIAAWDNLVKGKATVGEGYNIIGGTALEFGLAAVGAKAAKAKVAKAKSASAVLSETVSCRGKRSTLYKNELLFDPSLPSIPVDLLPLLPGKWDNVKLVVDVPVPSIISSTLSLMFVLNLMKIGHMRSKPYYEEECAKVYPNQKLEEYTIMLFEALSKRDWFETSDQLETTACRLLGKDFGCFLWEDEFKNGLQRITDFVSSTKNRPNIRKKGGVVLLGLPLAEYALHSTLHSAINTLFQIDYFLIGSRKHQTTYLIRI